MGMVYARCVGGPADGILYSLDSKLVKNNSLIRVFHMGKWLLYSFDPCVLEISTMEHILGKGGRLVYNFVREVTEEVDKEIEELYRDTIGGE